MSVRGWIGSVTVLTSLACAAGEPVATAPSPVPAPAPAPEPAHPGKAKKARGGGGGARSEGCPPGTSACSGSIVMFCEGGAWNAVEDCDDREGGVWLCIEPGGGSAECRMAD